MEGLHIIMRVLPYHTHCFQLLLFMHSGIKFGVKIDDFQFSELLVCFQIQSDITQCKPHRATCSIYRCSAHFMQIF